MNKYECALASISVDNAAHLVAKEVCRKLRQHHIVLPSRDPSHSTDLLSKDLAKTDVVSGVLADAKLVTDFCKTDRIDGIKDEMMADYDVEISTKAVSMSDTRMNLVHDYVEAALKQHDFVLTVQRNAKYQEYYQERTQKKKDELNVMFARFHGQNMWTKFKMLTSKLCVLFKQVQTVCSRADFPLTAYVLLVQALKNDVCRGLDDEFEDVFGRGSKEEIMSMIEERFNMDGADPAGRKVGLLDRMHLMCFIVDPYSHEWRSKFKLEENMSVIVNEMIEQYIPLGRDTDATRQRVRKEFMVRIRIIVLF